MKKLEVIKETSNQIRIEDIDLRKHVVVYANWEEILCKCKDGYFFIRPYMRGVNGIGAHKSCLFTIQEVFEQLGPSLSVYLKPTEQ